MELAGKFFDQVDARTAALITRLARMPPTIGLFAANMRAVAEPAAATRIARLAEDLGYDSLWVADHVAVPSLGSNRRRWSRTRPCSTRWSR